MKGVINVIMKTVIQKIILISKEKEDLYAIIAEMDILNYLMEMDNAFHIRKLVANKSNLMKQL